MTAAFKAARDYLSRDWQPIPVQHRGKKPTRKNWPDTLITEKTVYRYFRNDELNVGVKTGEPSNDLIDADLDCPEAVAIAPAIMPATGSIFGHGGVVGHLLYTCAGLRYLELTDPETGTTILELRGTGHQTVFPGSVHPSGEEILWIEDGAIAVVSAERLTAAARETGAAVLLVRAAPGVGGGRHAYMLDIAGSLVRSLGADGARRILAPVGKLVLGELYSERDEKRLIDGTVAKLANGGGVPDIGSLIARLGGKRAGKVVEWLGLRDARQEHGAAQAANLLRGAVPEEPGPEPAEGRPKIDIACDTELAQRPGGILQELAQWMAETHKRPQPELALGGAVSLLGLLCAHRYRTIRAGNDTRTNTNIVGLGASTSGKDHPRRCIKAVLAELGVADFVSEDLASGQALEGAFIDRFANLFLADEYGHRLAAALGAKASSSDQRLIEVITKLGTSAAGLYIHTRRAEHRHAPVPSTWDPCLVMFSTTVEEPLWAALRSKHVADGSVARHLFFKAATDYPELAYDVPHFEQRLPEMAAHALRVFTGDAGRLELDRRIGALRAQYEDDGRGGTRRAQPVPPQLIDVPISGAAEQELRRLDQEELELLRLHLQQGTSALVGRLVEHTTRLALICAVSSDPATPVIGDGHVLWAEAVAKRSLSTVLRAAALYVADTPAQASRNRLLRDLQRTAGTRWRTQSEITRTSQWSRARDLVPLLYELTELRLIEDREATVRGKAVKEYRCL